MSPPDDNLQDRLRAQVDVVRTGEGLGRSQGLDRLLQFLLDCSVEGRTPKELEIADQVFGRSGVNADQDSSVRVHIHRLRRKLDEFYAGPGAGEAERLAMPKGGYRLLLEPLAAHAAADGPAPVDDASPDPAPTSGGRAYALAAIGAVALLVLVACGTWWLARRPDAGLRTVRASAAWAPAIANGSRISLVVGDYYIFGERDADGDVTQLVRRFDINSAQNLDGLIATHPERSGVDVDLGLNYLPVGVGNALRVVTPVVRSDGYEPIGNLVVPVSQLSPEQLKLVNMVYLGYLSGLGTLRDPVFSGSRFAIGGSYDEIVDRRTSRSYMAGTHLDRNDQNPSREYALISCFPGVTGNWITVIAGTRDAALMQAADYATRPDGLAAATRSLVPGTAFDALVSVESLRNVGLSARLIVLSPRREVDWSGKPTQRFPDEFHESPVPVGTGRSPSRGNGTQG
ncbi:helix-turn-helix domain-containing protein [Sphingomonas bacterium]|uniref:helix-turn-helix domain-containing protein n=1 Tax=Sphingomonas bacterium TaxID=1895847 RepID=UPI00157524B3|nr:helix-turn-helix domain-containing protein [Sphingomonas bacterium]